MTHPRHGLDDLLTHAVRLSIAAALDGVERAEFSLIRDSVEITDSMLSKQVALLEEAGYVDVGKERYLRRTRTWLRLTAAGTKAYHRHVGALLAIANPAGNSPSPTAGPQPATQPTVGSSAVRRGSRPARPR